MTSAKQGVSAKTLQRLLGFGSYQTARTMLHRFRTAMVRPDRDRLSGEVEVDETLVGGEEHGGKRGRGAGRKSLVAVAVELRSPQGFGRVRMRCVPDASGASLGPFVCDAVARGATGLTDGWSGYHDLATHGFIHRRTIVSDSGDPLTSPCPVSTGWLPCSNDGFSAPTKAPSSPIICKATLTSLRFNSIGVILHCVACCAGGSSNKPCQQPP